MPVFLRWSCSSCHHLSQICSAFAKTLPRNQIQFIKSSKSYTVFNQSNPEGLNTKGAIIHDTTRNQLVMVKLSYVNKCIASYRTVWRINYKYLPKFDCLYKMATSIESIILGKTLVLHYKTTPGSPIFCTTMKNSTAKVVGTSSHWERVEYGWKLELHCQKIPDSLKEPMLKRVFRYHRKGSDQTKLDDELLIQDCTKCCIVISTTCLRRSLNTIKSQIESAI